jgi:uncharacterized membrane protein YqiK
MLETIMAYWWVLPILLCVIGYKFVLRVFFGMVIVAEDNIGLITKKFVLFGANKELPPGRIIATKGEAGFQAEPLPPGLHWGYWPWQYSIDMIKFITIPTGKIGLIDSKDGAKLEDGHILGRKVECQQFQNTTAFLDNGGEKGRQATYLPAGVYRINTNAFSISITDPTVIEEGKVGVVTTLDGAPLALGHIAGKETDISEESGHFNFQNFDNFLAQGGQRGLQPQVLQAGSYYINPWAVKIELQPMTEVPIGYVGVVISYIGEEGQDTSGEQFKHGNLVARGQRGVWADTFGPGKYALNRLTHKIELVPTTNIVLNWATGQNASHKLDQELSTIKVLSNDGFPFNLDVSQIIHVPAIEAPKVIARFGNMTNLVSQVLEPTIQNYFRNSAQNSDVIAFLSQRKQRQDEAKEHIKVVLEEYNVHAVDTLIGDIVPPKELMKTLTDRKIASEEEKTFVTQKSAEIQRQSLMKERSIADMQPEIVNATQRVEIAQRNADAAVKTAEGNAKATELDADGKAKAKRLSASADADATRLTADATAYSTKQTAEAEATKISQIGKAEAEAIEAKGKATADAYEGQVKAMGADNFGRLKVMEQIATGKVKVIPEVLIQGNGGSDAPISGLLSMQLLDTLKEKQVQPAIVTPATGEEAKAAKK